MTTRKIEKVVETVEHSFENVLGVPSGTTEMIKTRIRSESESHESYDHKDDEIEEDILVVHDKALELYNFLIEELEDCNSSKTSRIAEVAGQLLNTALAASEKRRVLKQHKDILKHKDKVLSGKGVGGKVTNNNVFVGSFAEVMGMMPSKPDLNSLESSDYDDVDNDVDDDADDDDDISELS